jgi:hypothetical protein
MKVSRNRTYRTLIISFGSLIFYFYLLLNGLEYLDVCNFFTSRKCHSIIDFLRIPFRRSSPVIYECLHLDFVIVYIA